MTAADGRVIGTTKIFGSGPSNKRLNIVLVSEGYRDEEMGAYAAHAQQFVDRLLATVPLDTYRCAFNVHRVDVVSNESGADDPAGYVGGYPNFHEAVYGQTLVYGCIFLKPHAAEWQDVPAATLGNPGSPEGRFRAVNDYAMANGFVGGFPNFHQADYGEGMVYGCLLIRQGEADWMDVPAATLGNPSSFGARMRTVHNFALAQGYAGGFPNFHQADYGQGLVYGCILLKQGFAHWQDEPAATLGNPGSSAARFRTVNGFAEAQGFVSGYPNFHEADYGQGTVYGCILLEQNAAEWRDVPVGQLC
jgi:hypothetical protein